MTMAAATAAFKDSHRGFMGIINSASASARISGRTPRPSLPMTTAISVSAAGCPEPASMENPFTDVQKGSFYEKPVLWAVENGITNGIDATHFGPTNGCNRAQVVTFLYRAYN